MSEPEKKELTPPTSSSGSEFDEKDAIANFANEKGVAVADSRTFCDRMEGGDGADQIALQSSPLSNHSRSTKRETLSVKPSAVASLIPTSMP